MNNCYASRKLFPVLLMVVSMMYSCNETPPKEPPLLVREDPAQAALKAKEIRENTAIQLADGLQLSLWASDSLAPDPIAMSIDDQGRVYLTRTNRQKNSEFDIRGHRDWMTPSIALQSVEDRRAFLHSTFAAERSEENSWLKDLNQDSLHDWRDLAIEKEEIWRIADESGDGVADVSMRIMHEFNNEVTDVAGALLVRNEDVFVGVGPDMWRLKDTDGDGVLDDKTSISHGYAVHIGFSGHGMSGAIEGPDGKIYWGIGDIGVNIKAPDGTQHKYPNQGVIVRANPDGSDFEVFAAGLRNTHEFVFDEYGNIISSDNDGDHPGEQERLVHIVEGSDAGWRANWQYGKYTDPKNNAYKVWMEEKLFKPRWEGQAAYIIPPIMNYHNGPTGMAYNPGTALGADWKKHFFLVEFTGNPSRSPIWAFRLQPKGASFELAEEKNILTGVLPTGIKFGPDGALYIADWINGWGTKNYGRVWKLDVSEDKNDLAAVRAETQKLMQLDYSKQEEDVLFELLANEDMRIRQKAQFELVARADKGAEVFQKTIKESKNQLARIHAIWGTGQMARKNEKYASSLLDLLNDNDPEIIAQTAKVLGDIKYTKAGEALVSLLKHEHSRVKFYAAQALGRIKYEKAVTPLIVFLKDNNDEDLYLRHAGVLALSRIGQEGPMVDLAKHPNRALRVAAVLVLRRLQSEKIALFLNDPDEYIVTEAARAINDDWSIEGALPALAETLTETRFTSEPLLRRGINACLRVGTEKELDILIAFAQRKDVSAELRAEALATLGTWANPSVLDRVDGRYRGEIQRDPASVKTKVGEQVVSFLQSKEPEVLIATAKMLANLQLDQYNDQLAAMMRQNAQAPVRAELLKALYQLKYANIETSIKLGMEDKDEAVRTVALSLLNELDISKENLPGIVNPIFQNGALREQQEMLKVLGKMPLEKSEAILAGLIEQVTAHKLPSSITLDLIEAVEATQAESLIAQLGPLKTNGNTVDAFQETLYGGDYRQGRSFFNTNSTGQCARCHSIGGKGGEVGPSLTHIGDQLSREQILQALIEPSARLAPGFGSVTLTLKDGQKVTGILMEERADELILKTSEAEPMEIPLSRIKERKNLPSSMPPMGSLMSKREIRDMVEFLSNLKQRK
ncbi:HEAT repeat domain-containing protein [Rapidithrix thailandica]|uniref:HEAT repeat domain-containing protein n=1 Tax=Rapidithrix thailandica TaxID=413964 RepID=A0AAW9SDS8_9BACT